jgi:hypothetical protein
MLTRSPGDPPPIATKPTTSRRSPAISIRKHGARTTWPCIAHRQSRVSIAVPPRPGGRPPLSSAQPRSYRAARKEWAGAGFILSRDRPEALRSKGIIGAPGRTGCFHPRAKAASGSRPQVGHRADNRQSPKRTFAGPPCRHDYARPRRSSVTLRRQLAALGVVREPTSLVCRKLSSQILRAAW